MLMIDSDNIMGVGGLQIKNEYTIFYEPVCVIVKVQSYTHLV